ncbi:MAG TPA: hypothetical protein VF158_12015 [Longimicrobiales bacterium]
MVTVSRLAAAGLVFLAACGSGGASPDAAEQAGLTDARFIEVYTALRQAARENPDTLAFDSARAEVLARYGVTEAQLFEFAIAHGGDVEAMAALWDTIQARLVIRDSAVAPD